MTPAARVAAAIEIVDQILAGEPAERALAGWGRAHRYAGSKDRAAISDHVYDVLRRRRSLAAHGGGDDGRALLLGLFRAGGRDPETIFTGERYAPRPLSSAERAAGREPAAGGAEAADMPDWLWPHLQRSLGADALPVATALAARAPVHLRVNLARLSRAAAQDRLTEVGVETRAHCLSPAALEVTAGARTIRSSTVFQAGLVELQDAASQAVADMVPLRTGERMLDYCAGGGGKTLAVAGRVAGRFFAHDVAPQRMKDLPSRAARAGITVELLTAARARDQASFDTVLIDAPCSGSGSWRRDPQGKWRLTPDRLAELAALQAAILDRTAPLVGVGGHLVYATCSLLDLENDAQMAAFLRRDGRFRLMKQRQFTPLEGGDGFFSAVLVRTRS